MATVGIQPDPDQKTDLIEGGEAIVDRFARGEITLEQFVAALPAARKCGCRACLFAEGKAPVHMIVCPSCGNKRCPKAAYHALECTGSNEPGQPGSAYQ